MGLGDRDHRDEMTRSCKLCGRLSLGECNACASCSRRAAAYVLGRAPEAVRHFWDVDKDFAARRDHFLSMAARRHGPDASNLYAGLAVGYLGRGFRSDALLAAAMSIDEMLDPSPCCWSATDVLFNGLLLRIELMDELAVKLSAIG